MSDKKNDSEYFAGKDIFLLPDGATYHVGVKPGQVYPRILTVGSVGRAKAISKHLDSIEVDIFSSRLFQTFSGKYKGVGVSIIAIGMGAPMMDFMVREVSHVQPSPLAIIRLGTCGLWDPTLPVGTVVTAGPGCAISYQNYAKWSGGVMNEGAKVPDEDYFVSKPIKGSDALNSLLIAELKKEKVPTADGVNISGDSFFACQGRRSGHFENGNAPIIEQLAKKNKVSSMEMESYTLFLLGKMRTVAPLHAAACHIGLVQRVDTNVETNIGESQLHALETQAGRVCLETLVRFDIGDAKYPPLK